MSAITITGIIQSVSVQRDDQRMLAISDPADYTKPSVLITLPAADAEGIEVGQAVEVIVQAVEQAD